MDDNNTKLLEQFFRIVMLLHRYPHHHPRKREFAGNPHRGQGRVLALLKLQPEISQKELSYLLDMRNQSLGELLMKLERSGFITREPSETDRRVMNIKLTEAGAAAANQAEEQQEDNGKLFDCLSEEERIQLIGYLNRLIQELEQRLGVDALGEQERGDFRRGMYPGSPFDPRGRGRGHRGGFPYPGGHSHGEGNGHEGCGHRHGQANEGPHEHGHGPDHTPNRGTDQAPDRGPYQASNRGPDRQPLDNRRQDDSRPRPDTEA